jgi:molybdopterin-containing oxidoreductase family iron-sulfur binding subunit
MKYSRRSFLKDMLVTSVSVIIGAEMKLPSQLEYSISNNNRERKWVFMIDLNRCDGCKKCTEACINEMHVPPAWGEPSYEGRQPWIQVFDNGEFFLPVPCQNCQNAPCAKVCPVGATFYSEDHIVLIDQDRCIGCRICMAACPYERRFFNWFDPPVTPEELKIQYSPDYNVPHRRGVVEKCIWCRHRLEMGRLPACVEACTKAGMRALFFGDMNEDVVTNGVETYKFSDMIKNGYVRLKEDLGTEPRVYYLPKRRQID